MTARIAYRYGCLNLAISKESNSAFLNRYKMIAIIKDKTERTRIITAKVYVHL